MTRYSTPSRRRDAKSAYAPPLPRLDGSRPERRGIASDDVVERTDAILASTESVVARLHDGDRVTVVVAPCSPFSVSAELMRESAALARRLGLRLHTHLAETIAEERDCLARFGKRPLDVVTSWMARRGRLVRPRCPSRRVGGSRSLQQAPGGALPELERPARVGAVPGARLIDAGAPVGSGSTVSPRTRGATCCPKSSRRFFSRACVRPARRPDAEPGIRARHLGRCPLPRPSRSRPSRGGAPADIAVWPADDIADIADPIAGLVLGPSRQVSHLLVGGDAVVTAARS